MAAHQGQLLAQGHQLDQEGADIRFFDHQAAAGFEHSPQLGAGAAGAGHVVQGIHHNDAVKAGGGEGQALALAGRHRQAGFLLRLAQHTKGDIRQNTPLDVRGQGMGHSPGSAAHIQQDARERCAACGRQPGQLGQASHVCERDHPFV